MVTPNCVIENCKDYGHFKGLLIKYFRYRIILTNCLLIRSVGMWMGKPIDIILSVPEKLSWFIRHICPMGFVWSIQICEISHQTFGPSRRKCVQWFSWTLNSSAVLQKRLNYIACCCRWVRTSVNSIPDQLELSILLYPNNIIFGWCWHYGCQVVCECRLWERLIVQPTPPLTIS